VGTAFAVSLLTGGIGGIAYGASGTDVFGFAAVRVKLIDVRQGRVVLEREYEASAKDNRSKFNCDTPATYREMAAGAFKQVIEDLKEDLRKITSAVENPSPAD
jgi:ribulose kinase